MAAIPLQYAVIFVAMIGMTWAKDEFGPGSPCGIPYGSQRWITKGDEFLCGLCAKNEYWNRDEKTCSRCEGTKTNLEPNVRTSCKDDRPTTVKIPRLPTTVEVTSTPAPTGVPTTGAVENTPGPNINGTTDMLTSTTDSTLRPNRTDELVEQGTIGTTRVYHSGESEQIGTKGYVVIAVLAVLLIAALAAVAIMYVKHQRRSSKRDSQADVEQPTGTDSSQRLMYERRGGEG